MAEKVITTEQLLGNDKKDIFSTEELFGRNLPPVESPSISNYIKFKLNMDKANAIRSNYGSEAMWGRMDTQVAIQKGNEEKDYWIAQAGPYEEMALKDFPKDPVRFIAGEGAQLIPYMLSSQVEGLKYGLTLGTGFAAITAVAGQVPPLTVMPEEFVTVPAAFGMGMKTGYTYGVINNILHREGGGLYLDMTEKGISEDTARPLALAGGALIGIIELAQFKLLSKPFKQAFSKVIRTKIGKAAIAHAVGRYLKTVGGEVLEEDLQEVTSLVTETIASVIDDNPDAAPTPEEWKTRLLETTARSLAGLAVISAPGGVVDVTTTFRAEKLVKKKEDIALLDKIIKEAQAKERPVTALEIKLPEVEEKKDYEIAHRPSKTSPVYDLTKGGIIPKDIYTHPEYYANMTQKTYQESYAAIQRIKGKPESMITVYRASPKNELNEGDWISLSKSYAELESLVEGTPVHSFRVKAKDVFFTGDDINEFGYFGKSIGIKAPIIAPEEPKVGIKPEVIKPDVSGIRPLVKAIQDMVERKEAVSRAEYTLSEIDTVRDEFKHRIRKYEKGYLKEELTGIPSIYITKEGGITPDEAMEELRDRGIEIRDESALKEYLQDLEVTRRDLLAEIEKEKPGFVRKREDTLLKERIRAVEIGIREGKVKTKRAVKAVQTELIEIIEAADLEAEDRAKFLRLIKNIQTQRQLEGILPEITDRITILAEKSQRKYLTSELKSLLNNVPENIPVRYKDAIERVKANILPEIRGKKKLAQLESMRDFVSRMIDEGEEINIPPEKLALLDMQSTEGMSIGQLEDLVEAIERLYHQGRLANKLLTTQKNRQFDEVKDQIIGIITKGEGLLEESSIIKALREQNKNLAKKSIEKVRNYIIENLRPELMLNILDGMQPGFITETVFNCLWESSKQELTESQKVVDTIKDIHKGLNFAEIFNKKYKIDRFTGMTKDNAMFILANSYNDANRLHLIGSGLTDEDITAIENFLSDEEKKAVNDMIRFYDEYQWPVLDEIYSDLEGVHLGKEFKYFPIDRVEDISYNKELEKEILQRSYIRRTGISKGFTKERVSSQKGYSEFSYFGTILRNYRKVEHYKAYAKSIRDANKILSNKEIKAAVQDRFGDKYYQVLDKWLKDVAYGGSRQAVSSIDNISRWLRTNYATAVIGGNLLSVMKAPISYIQGAEKAGKWNTLKSTLQFITAPLDWNEKIAEKSTLMEYRAMRQERELNEIIAQRTKAGQLGKFGSMRDVYQFIREKSMLPWLIADKTTTNIIWLAAYTDAKADMSEQKAIDYADMIIRRTQPMSGALNLPDTFRGPEYQKLFTIFRNQPNQNFNLLMESILQKQKGKVSNADFMSHLVFYVLVPSVMIGVISRKRLPEDPAEFAKDILNGALGGLIYLGNVTNFLSSGFMGSTTPIDSLYDDIYSATTIKDPMKKLDKIISLISKLIGFPYLGIKRIVKGEPFGKPKGKKKKGLEPI